MISCDFPINSDYVIIQINIICEIVKAMEYLWQY